MKIERFDCGTHYDGGVMLDSDDGEYVYHKDYATLEAKCVALAAENAGLKSKGRELLSEACKVYEKFNATISSDSGDFIDWQTLHEFQFMLDVETPATDALLAEVRAQGVEMAACALDDVNQFNYANMLDDLAQKLRKGASL